VPLELQSRDSGGLRAHEVSRPEPMPQRQVAVLKHSACGDPHVLPAPATPESTQPHFPPRPVAAPGTLKPLRPADTDQVVSARALGGEAPLEFPNRSRELGIPLGCPFSLHTQGLLAFLVPSSA
jgi:hypothetical protein